MTREERRLLKLADDLLDAFCLLGCEDDDTQAAQKRLEGRLIAAREAIRLRDLLPPKAVA